MRVRDAEVRRAEDRGHAEHGWLDSRHTFSFADYHDPKHMGFRALRVLNEDRVAPGQGFGTHGHREMEIISYVIAGALEHKDSMGTGSVIRPGDVQRMSAGTGVTHSEYNASRTEPVHFLQIWLIPDARGIAPSYEQKSLPAAEQPGKLCLIASPDGSEGSVTIHVGTRLYAAVLGSLDRVEHVVRPGRHAWIQVVRGTLTASSTALAAGDGVSTSDAGSILLQTTDHAEVLVFDLA